MQYEVGWKRKIDKKIAKMPESEQKKFALLVADWVACWYCEKNSIVIEVTYAGSREDAPY